MGRMQRARRIGAALSIALALSACLGKPHGVLVPTSAQAPGATPVDILVATDRNADGAPEGEMFTGERGQALSYADISVSIPPDSAREIGAVQWPASLPADPAHEFTTLRADVLSRDAALARFNARIARTNKRQALVFIHGFNTRFEEAVYRFAQIVHDSGADVTPVLFTWPSRGKLFAYGYDRESSTYSRDALEDVLHALARDPSVGEISILAHSMGNWLTLEALRQMAIRDKGLPAKLANVMLAAPDVDFDVFQRQIAQIGARPSQFTVFVSRDDGALAASKRVWGDKPRVGAVDPQEQPWRDDFKRDGVTVVDLSNVQSSDPLGHGKFASSPNVVRAIGARLAGGQTLSDGGGGVGDKFSQVAVGAASTLGSAAGVAVAAPFAIIDPRTRESLGDQFEQLGANVGATVQSGAAAATSPLK
jgi:esterase/lipase superfamily enzyme